MKVQLVQDQLFTIPFRTHPIALDNHTLHRKALLVCNAKYSPVRIEGEVDLDSISRRKTRS